MRVIVIFTATERILILLFILLKNRIFGVVDEVLHHGQVGEFSIGIEIHAQTEVFNEELSGVDGCPWCVLSENEIFMNSTLSVLSNPFLDTIWHRFASLLH